MSQMLPDIYFTATRIPVSTKALQPDDQGRYTILVGGLNCLNNRNQMYISKGCEHLFQDSSDFMRRVQNRVLKGEVDHPELHADMTDEEIIKRLYQIPNKNTCCLHQEIILKPASNSDFIGIYSKLSESGPHGGTLLKALQNPNEDVCFSIRGLSRNYVENGRLLRVLVDIITFDWVPEPGVPTSTKFNTPSMESFYQKRLTKGLIDKMLSKSAQKAYALEDNTLEALERTRKLFDIDTPHSCTKIRDW